MLREGIGRSRFARGVGGFVYSPLSLFAGGAPGAWYDPSDINLNWRYNLLTYTEQFDNAAWTKTGNGQITVTANQAVAPDGTTTADLVVPNALSGYHVIRQPGSTPATRCKQFIYYKPAGYTKVGLREDYVVGQFAAFNCTGAGSILSQSVGATASITALANGWYELTLTPTTTSSNQGMGFYVMDDGYTSNDPPGYIYTGNGTSGGYLWGASITTAANASLPYQQIVTPEISYLNYQPQPILYQDSAGTTPVTAVEQPVGLMLDKSQKLVLGSERKADFVTDIVGTATAATYNTTTGLGSVTRVDASNQSYVTLGSLSSGFYKATISCQTGFIIIRAGSVSGTQQAAIIAGQTVDVYVNTVNGISISHTTSAGSSTFTVVSVRELPGNHAFQSTAASRPVLSARYNLLTKTEQFDDAGVWSTTSGVTFSSGVAAFATTAYRYQAYTHGTSIAGLAFTARVKLHSPTGKATIVLRVSGSSTPADDAVLVVNLTSTPTVYTLTRIFTSTNTGIFVGLDNRPSESGDGIAGDVVATEWSIVPSNQSTLPYQRVNTATDYNTTGFLPYLKFDGVDDSLSTNSISFTATDKMSVFAGVNSPSATQYSCICALGNFNAQAGAMALASPGLSTYGAAAWVRGLSGRSSADNVSTALKRLVLTAQLSPSAASIADSVNVRINGGSGQGGNSGSLPGGGNFANATLSIGYTAGLNYLNGQMYSMIIVGKAVTAGELTSSETYVNQKTGAY